MASLIVGRKFTIFALFYFVFEGNFQVQAPGGAYIWRDDLSEGFCVTSLGGLFLERLIHGGAYFRNFTEFYKSSTREDSSGDPICPPGHFAPSSSSRHDVV